MNDKTHFWSQLLEVLRDILSCFERQGTGFVCVVSKEHFESWKKVLEEATHERRL